MNAKKVSSLWMLAVLSLTIGLFSLNCTSGAKPSEETISDAATGGDKTVTDGGSQDTNSGNDSTTKDEPSKVEPSPMKGKLVLNEVAAAGDPNDWFELHNTTDKDIDLSGYTVADDLKDDTKRVKFPKGTIIKAGAYMKFEVKASPDWPGFKLGGDEELGLWDKDGKLVDSANWDEGASPAGKSWGRFPDATGNFKTLGKPTPGAKNEDKTTQPPTCKPTTDKVVINEVAAAGDPVDWFELYNGTCKDIDLSAYTVSDDLTDPAARVKFLKGTIIKAGEYKRFDLKPAPDWPDFKLGSDEALGLWDKDGKLVDSADWDKDASPKGGSWARFPNGTGKFKTVTSPTPGAANKE